MASRNLTLQPDKRRGCHPQQAQRSCTNYVDLENHIETQINTSIQTNKHIYIYIHTAHHITKIPITSHTCMDTYKCPPLPYKSAFKHVPKPIKHLVALHSTAMYNITIHLISFYCRICVALLHVPSITPSGCSPGRLWEVEPNAMA